jgi:hypothetical protein
MGKTKGMNRMAGWGKTPRLNTLEGDPVQRGKEFKDLRFRYTWDIIEAAEKGLLPDRIMINTHPQRWGRDRGQKSAVRNQRTKDQKERSGI